MTIEKCYAWVLRMSYENFTSAGLKSLLRRSARCGNKLHWDILVFEMGEYNLPYKSRFVILLHSGT